MTAKDAGKMSDFNRTEAEANLIKQEYFQDILEKQYGKCSIKKFNLQLNSGGGENYMSVMYRLSIDVEKEDGSEDSSYFVVKLMSPYDSQAQFKKMLKAFEKEVEMYGEVVPKFEEIYREHGVEVKFAPKLWKYMKDPEILIMEDLKVKNFSNINRLKGMDMKHTEMTLSKLAQFHAASVCVLEKFGPFSELLMTGFIPKQMEAPFKDMQKMVWESFCNNMRTWGCCEKYLEKMEKLTDRVADIQLKVFGKNDDDFNVLVHGDFWANNIMFQHNEKEDPQEVIFVDMQVSRFASPIQELIYFIISSTDLSIKVKEFDYFIKFYHDELSKNLKLLEYPKEIPKLVDLHITAVRICFLGIVCCTGILGAALLEPNQNATIESFLEDSATGNEFKKDFYTNPRLVEACKVIFPWLENKGAFDMYE